MTDLATESVRSKCYPRSVSGRFRTAKYALLALAYLIYYGLPWLPWKRAVGPDQAVLFDIVGRKYYLFDLVVHPQQIFWLGGFLMIAALLLFFVTGLAGRIFCGYFCFQTLWTDMFLLIEHWVQGERPARIRLDRQAWNTEKLRKKSLTHAFWLMVAFWTALTFTLYWGPAGELLTRFVSGTAPVPMYITTLILTISTYTMAGFARDQVCTHMCPYSRFQSAMFDRDTKLVAYNRSRGEGDVGRAKASKEYKTREARQTAGIGDCIDCGYCVQVCPTGIDIRNGLQVQCIHCGLCIDACDNIMDNLGWARGLIRFSSDTEDQGGKVNYFKIKNIGYGVALAAITGILLYSVFTNSMFETAINQVRQPLFVTLSDGSIQNSYDVKLANLDQRPLRVALELAGLDGAEIDTGRFDQIELRGERQVQILAKVRRAPESRRLDKVSDFGFVVRDLDTQRVIAEIPARFYTPKND
ncbi:MAG: cytochrome c oxidase accessory protein CcoG [Thiotrichales bacterium]